MGKNCLINAFKANKCIKNCFYAITILKQLDLTL